MARRLAGLALALFCSAAQAQTTTCQTNAITRTVTCYTPPAPGSYGGGGPSALGLLIQMRQAAKANARDKVILQNVTDMIKAGDCDNAVTAALNAGKMKLAAQARAICKPVAEPYAP